VRIALTLLMIVLMAGCISHPVAVPATASPAASPSTSPLPSGGISQARAIAIAREHTGDAKTFVSATAGRFGDLQLDPTGHPASSPEPSHLVWAIRFRGEFVICPPHVAPSGSTTPAPQECWSPRPGTTVVFLDFHTGDWLTTESMS
jgi:hypothetical protein